MKLEELIPLLRSILRFYASEKHKLGTLCGYTQKEW